jgi:hypothetical protein
MCDIGILDLESRATSHIRCLKCPQYATYGPTTSTDSPPATSANDSRTEGINLTVSRGALSPCSAALRGWGGAEVTHCIAHKEEGERALKIVPRQWRIEPSYRLASTKVQILAQLLVQTHKY